MGYLKYFTFFFFFLMGGGFEGKGQSLYKFCLLIPSLIHFSIEKYLFQGSIMTSKKDLYIKWTVI